MDTRPPCPACQKRREEYRRNQEAKKRASAGKRGAESNAARRIVHTGKPRPQAQGEPVAGDLSARETGVLGAQR